MNISYGKIAPLFLITLLMTGITPVQAMENENNKIESISKVSPEEKILEDLKKNELIPSSAKIEKVINGGAYSDQIIFIEGENSFSVVAKVVTPEGAFSFELKNLKDELSLTQSVNKLTKKSKVQLPLISEYKGSMEIEGKGGVILLERAYGKEIYDYIKDIKTLEDKTIKEIFTSIGEQFGAFDAFLLKEMGKRLNHRDSRARNFLYDEEKKQVYWIDTSGLELKEDPDGLRYLIMLKELKPSLVDFYEAFNSFLSWRIYKQFNNDKFKGNKKYYDEYKEKIKLINNDFQKEFIKNIKEKKLPTNLDKPKKQYTNIKNMIDYLTESGISKEDFQSNYVEYAQCIYKPYLTLWPKQILAAKSFSEGYLAKNDNEIVKNNYSKKIELLKNNLNDFNKGAEKFGLSPNLGYF